MENTDELTETQNRNYVSAYGMAVIYTRFGDKDRAFEWLHKAYEERSNWLIYLKVYPTLDSLRTDPRFTDLVRLIFH